MKYTKRRLDDSTAHGCFDRRVVTIVRPAPPAIDPVRSAPAVLLVHSNTVSGSFGALQLKQPVSVVHNAGSIAQHARTTFNSHVRRSTVVDGSCSPSRRSDRAAGPVSALLTKRKHFVLVMYLRTIAIHLLPLPHARLPRTDPPRADDVWRLCVFCAVEISVRACV